MLARGARALRWGRLGEALGDAMGDATGAGRPLSTAAAPAPAPGLDHQLADAALADWDAAKPFHAIPGPTPYPLLGNLPRFLPGIGEYGNMNILDMQRALRKNFGDIVRLTKLAGKNDMIWVFDPTIVEKMYRKEGKWPIREGVKTIHYYRTVERKEKYDGVLGTVTTQRKEWHDFRSKVNQPLMQRKSTNQYFAPVNDIADEFIDRMRNLLDDNRELPADFINELYKWALESITMVALDTRLGCLAPNLAKDSEPQRMIDSVQDMLEGIYRLDIRLSPWRIISTPMWRRMVNALDYFNDVAEKYVSAAMARRGENPNRPPSILEKMMESDPRVAKVMATDLLFGGVDTTSHLTGSLIFFLAKNPEVQKKLGEEIRRVLPSKSSPVTEAAVNDMTYFKACLRESLRIFPIAMGNSREAPTDIVLGGYQIPKGTQVMMCGMIMSRDEKNFPRPLSFEPERWLRGSAAKHGAHPFTSLPFGFGPRTCVGRRFAEMETTTLVSKIFRNFWVEFHHGDELIFEPRTLNCITMPLKFRLIEHEN